MTHWHKILQLFRGHTFFIPLACLVGATVGHFIPAGLDADLVAATALPLCLIVLIAIGLIAYGCTKAMTSRNLLRENLGLLVLSGGVILLYSLVDHHVNKVVLDELILQSSALQLTETNEYKIPQFSHNLKGEDYLILGEGVPDKRPPMFPVLLSLIHRTLGYNQANGFLLNAALGFCLLVAVGKVGEFLYRPHGGTLAILGIASLPLLSQNITSQHLEILYLLLIAIQMWIALRVATLEKAEEIPITYLLAACIGLTRYEGLLFFAIPFFLHLDAALKGKSVGGLWPVYVICPLSTLFIFTLLGHVGNYPEFWQLDDLDNGTAFGVHYWPKNVGACLDFMLSSDRHLPGSLALSIAGLASLPISLVLTCRQFLWLLQGRETDSSEFFPIGLFLLCLAVFLSLIFSYHWGFVNSHVTARFLLFPYVVMTASVLFVLSREPFWLMVLGIMLALVSGLQTVIVDNNRLDLSHVLVLAGFTAGTLSFARKRPQTSLVAGMLFFWALFIILETLPAINQRKYEASYIPLWRTKVFAEWVEARSDENAVFISDTPLYGMLGRESATSTKRFGLDPAVLLTLATTKRFSNLYVLQETSINPNGRHDVAEAWQLPENILTETLETHRITDDFGVQLLRITGMHTPENETVNAYEGQPTHAGQGN